MDEVSPFLLWVFCCQQKKAILMNLNWSKFLDKLIAPELKERPQNNAFAGQQMVNYAKALVSGVFCLRMLSFLRIPGQLSGMNLAPPLHRTDSRR